MTYETQQNLNLLFGIDNPNVSALTDQEIEDAYDQGDIPNAGDFNFVIQQQDRRTKYLGEQGIPLWSTDTDYPLGAIVKTSNGVYIANAANSGQVPTNTDQSTYWTRTVANRRIATESEVAAGTSTTTLLTPKLVVYMKAALKLEMNPVGTVLTLTNNKNPNTFIGGTWARVASDTTLSTTYTSDSSLGTVVGSNTVNVPLPSHVHTAKFVGSSLGTKAITGTVTNAPHYHNQDGGVSDTGRLGFFGSSRWITSSGSDYIRTEAFRYNGSTTGGAYWRTDTHTTTSTFKGNSISLGTPKGSVSVESTGEDNAIIDVRGKRLLAIMWIRTA